MMVFHHIGPGVSIKILGFALLNFLLWPVEAVLSRVVANLFPWNCRKLESSPKALHNLGFAEVRMAILSDGMWFLVVNLISIPPIIISNEHLVLRLLRVFFLKGCREILCLQLTSWKLVVFGTDFCSTHPRSSPEGSCH